MNKLAIKMSSAPAAIDHDHFRPEMARMVQVVLEESPETADGYIWITSGKDSHNTGLHPVGLALDFRANNIKSQNLADRRSRMQAWGERVWKRLGSDYYIVGEEHNISQRDHLHCEFDPD